MITINPAENTVNTFTVGVTNTSNTARTFTISVDSTSTLDPSYYEIESLTGTIPAGSYVGEIQVTTFATTDFPQSGSQLIINLKSVEGTPIINAGTTTKSIDFRVACAFDSDASVGNYILTQDAFETVLSGDGSFSVVAGPEENQITLIDPFGYGNTDYELVVDVDPVTGEADVAEQNVWDAVALGYPASYGQGTVAGSGFVFSCLESMQFELSYCVEIRLFWRNIYYSCRKAVK